MCVPRSLHKNDVDSFSRGHFQYKHADMGSQTSDLFYNSFIFVYHIRMKEKQYLFGFIYKWPKLCLDNVNEKQKIQFEVLCKVFKHIRVLATWTNISKFQWSECANSHRQVTSRKQSSNCLLLSISNKLAASVWKQYRCGSS